jgi:hypothetical protein
VSPLADQLSGLAERRADAVLTAAGRDGEVHLLSGVITHAGRPGAAHGGDDRPGADALTTWELALDALRAFLHPATGSPARWRASRNPRPLDPAGLRLRVPAVLAEARRRQALLERLEPVVGLATPLTRRAELPDAAVRVTPAQWALLALLDVPATPGELAGALGDSPFRTLCRSYELVTLGLLTTPAGDVHPPATAFLAG